MVYVSVVFIAMLIYCSSTVVTNKLFGYDRGVGGGIMGSGVDD